MVIIPLNEERAARIQAYAAEHGISAENAVKMAIDSFTASENVKAEYAYQSSS